jgi:hypothetical protein
VVLEQGAQVAGGITTVFGDIRLQNAAQVGGDVVAVGGVLRRDAQASIGGSVTSMGGGVWTLLILLLPLALVGGVVALIVWLVRRKRQVVPVAA